MLGKITAVLCLVLVTGCSTVIEQAGRDPRDAPWDPRDGSQLFEQIPNWDGNAARVCCGHLRVCEPHQTPRC